MYPSGYFRSQVSGAGCLVTPSGSMMPVSFRCFNNKKALLDPSLVNHPGPSLVVESGTPAPVGSVCMIVPASEG